MIAFTNFRPVQPVLMAIANDDALWVSRCLQGDTSAFEVLVRRYQRVVHSVAYRLTGCQEDAQDVAQNAFLRAYERLDSYDPERKFFSWMYRIAVNESLNYRRTQKPHDPIERALPIPAADDPVARLEQTERIQSALMSLSPEYRELIVLKYFSDLSYDEISHAVGIPEKTVKSRLFTARQQLEALLAGDQGKAS
jgi:RNA polymerase sigma-70 factor (ECF subfamily)